MSKHKYMTVEDVADEFCISTATIYRGIRQGQIPALRILTSIRVPRSWVEAQTATFGPVIEDVHHNHPAKVAEPVKVTITSNGTTEGEFDLNQLISVYEGDGGGCE